MHNLERLENNTRRAPFLMDYSSEGGREEWVPSQRGGLWVCLQLHKAIFVSASTVKRWGVNSVPAWEPSHIGCLLERPQAHQA